MQLSLTLFEGHGVFAPLMQRLCIKLKIFDEICTFSSYDVHIFGKNNEYMQVLMIESLEIRENRSENAYFRNIS